jgi:tRNA(fMet)-specific endonuclease VapC
LRAGAAKSSIPQKTTALLGNFLAPIQILSFDSGDALVYGSVRSNLEKAGMPIGPMDMLIAAHAINRSLVLVTNNLREFSRVEGLKIQNWQVKSLPSE